MEDLSVKLKTVTLEAGADVNTDNSIKAPKEGVVSGGKSKEEQERIRNEKLEQKRLKRLQHEAKSKLANNPKEEKLFEGLLSLERRNELLQFKYTDDDLRQYFPIRTTYDTLEDRKCSPKRVSYTDIENMIISFLKENSPSAQFVQVTPDYYSFKLETRQKILNAPSPEHLCKTVIMENTHHNGEEGNIYNARYYAVVIQYVQKLNCERVKDIIKNLNPKGALPNKKLNFNFAREETASELTGFVRNAVTPFCMKEKIPVILSKTIVDLNPPLLWVGGGEVDSKIGILLSDFIKLTDCIIGDVCFPNNDNKEICD